MVISTELNTLLKKATAQMLACPDCHGPLILHEETLRCTMQSCRRVLVLSVSDDVVMAEERLHFSPFDYVVEVMSARDPGTRCVFFSQQTKWLDFRLARLLGEEPVVVDVGCGPKLPYRRSRRYFLIGVDPSFESVRRNDEVDLRVFGKAARLPLRDASVDVVLCSYSLHHMVGQSVSDNRLCVQRAFSEFGRVLKPGGYVYAFDNSPPWPVDLLQRAVWNIAKGIYAQLDMFFWSWGALRDISLQCLPGGAEFRRWEFKGSPWVIFPFVCAWTHLKLPRLLFPLRTYAYEWRMPCTERKA